MSLKIIPADESHIPFIFSFIQKMAAYEKLSHQLEVSTEQLHFHLIKNKSAHCILAIEDNIPIGFALYFFNFSTFKGKQGLYLEDIYVEEAHRGKGYGKQLFLALVKIAKQHQCGRMEWSVLNWNKPAIDFYKSLGATPMDEWTVYRLTEEKIIAISDISS
ncbi:MAG: GNAT family N-acetyltransferase [Chitinophagaceae bacterium]|nr:MAG: N-acetyltransferase GCN5 [Bacteroidetes bacterium OLB11]MCC6448191.1 GNAT family N-acetyltransferase [Chitinophagaceae bacterium]HMN32373.1 GNAT family N-acetyltransferase [Chitinophagaceae bacterium]